MTREETLELFRNAEFFAKKKIELLKMSYPKLYDDEYFENADYESKYFDEYIEQVVYGRRLLEDYMRKKGGNLC